MSEDRYTTVQLEALADKVSRHDATTSGMLTAVIFLLLTVLGFGAAWVFSVDRIQRVKQHIVVAPADPPDNDPPGMKDTSFELGELPVEMPHSDQETPQDGAASDVRKDLLQVVQQPDFIDPSRLQAKGGGPQGLDKKGDGVGKDGVPRDRRWIVEWANESRAEYKKKLDFFHIYLGVYSPSKGVVAVTGFTGNLKKTTSPPDVFFQHANPMRKQVDRDILQSAGVNSSGGVVAQFIPKETESLMLQTELKFAKRPEKEIKKTTFGIRGARDGYEFCVVDQEYH
jgi:hypothetical protein